MWGKIMIPMYKLNITRLMNNDDDHNHNNDDDGGDGDGDDDDEFLFGKLQLHSPGANESNRFQDCNSPCMNKCFEAPNIVQTAQFRSLKSSWEKHAAQLHNVFKSM